MYTCTNHTVPYGNGSFGAALSQALRARLRSHRPYGTFRHVLFAGQKTFETRAFHRFVNRWRLAAG
jgi:hypothetical protein